MSAITRTTISDSFGMLIERLQPLGAELDAARQHLATIRTRLETVFAVSDCKKIGSFARGTSIRGFSDSDLLAIFRRTEFTWGGHLINSDTALENVRRALMERYPSTPIRRDVMAIVVSFSDGRQVDVVPAIFQGMYDSKWPTYLIPDGTGGWMPTCPSLFDAYIGEGNRQSGGKLIYVAQLMKFWRECRNPRVPISSFHIEMALTSETVCKGVKPYADCVLDLLRSLARRECRAIRDPKGIAGNIPAVKTESQRERSLATVVSSRDQAQRAVTANALDDIDEARRQWRLVFNGKFLW